MDWLSVSYTAPVDVDGTQVSLGIHYISKTQDGEKIPDLDSPDPIVREEFQTAGGTILRRSITSDDYVIEGPIDAFGGSPIGRITHYVGEPERYAALVNKATAKLAEQTP